VELSQASDEAIIELQVILSVSSLNKVVLCFEAKLARLTSGETRN